jgi:peptidoglycan/LPS O-acetylase OafA/YrhL
MSSGEKYRRDIQALRGLAVLAVVLFHANESYFPLGYLGVDVFFVISGFVVMPLILLIFTNQDYRGSRLSNLRYFYSRRFYRLAPALATTLVISAILIFLFGPIGDHQRFARQSIATLLLAGNIGAYKYSGDYFSPNPNPLVHTWSLSVEAQIYIFLPFILILILGNRKSFKKITVWVLAFISAISFLSFLTPAILQPLYSVSGIEDGSQFSFYSPIDRIWQFTVGGLLYLLLDRYRNRTIDIKNGPHLLLLFAVIFILFGPINVSQKTASILASLSAVSIILFKSLDSLPNFLIRKLEWIGDRSYSIYLVHMPLLYLAHSPATLIGSIENRLIQTTIAVAASILLGALSYSRIENRYRNYGNRGASSTAGTSKVLPPCILSILSIFLFFLGFLGTSSTSMYKDRLDNDMCKFWTPNLDQNFYKRFIKCQSQFGSAIVVLGDSHAMNIYNSLFLTTRNSFFVGISAGGCRPNTQSDSCPYDNFARFLKSSPNSIKQVIFHQSGSYLISDERGNVDTNLAFRSQISYRILDNDIKLLIRYLNDMSRRVATTWIGPFPELRLEPTWIQVKTNQVKPNPVVKKAFFDLEKKIKFYIEQESTGFNYVSLIRILGPRQFEYKVGECLLFRDTDHWSTCGEEIFSLPISKGLR